MTEQTHEAAPVEAAAAPPQAAPAMAPAGFAPSASPMQAQLARSASAMGNQAFGHWAQTAGAAGDPVPSLSAHSAWGSTLARAPEGATAPAPAGSPAPAAGDDAAEPIEVKGMQFGQQLLDGVMGAEGGELSKTISAKLGKYQKAFGPYSLQVPLVPGVYAKFGAGGAMSANADASLTMAGTNVASAAFGQAKKQEVRASGTGTAKGAIAGSMTAGLHIGVDGLANVGVVGQGTLALEASGTANFSGSIKRFKQKGSDAWMPWSGEVLFDADIKGSLIASANGYFEYQVLWIYKDQFGKFKIGTWTLAEAGLKVKGSMKPGAGLTVNIEPWVGELMKPGVTPEIRARSQEEVDKAEKLAQQGQSGGPPIARKADLRLARDEDPPPAAPPAAPPAPPEDAGSSAAAPGPATMAPPVPAPAGGGGGGLDTGGDVLVTIEAEPKIEQE